MASVIEFGKHMRSIYPSDCEGFSDLEVGELFKEEEPEIYAEFLKSHNPIVYQAEPVEADYLNQLEDGLDPKRGWVRAKYRNPGARKRGELGQNTVTDAHNYVRLQEEKAYYIRTQTQIASAKFTYGHNEASLIRGEKETVANHARIMALLDNEQRIIKKATKQEFLASIYINKEDQRQQNILELERKEKESQITLTEEEKRSDIAVKEQQQMEQVKTDQELKRTLNTLDAILKYKTMYNSEFKEIFEQLRFFINEREKALKTQATKDELEVINQSIKVYQGRFNGLCKALESGDREIISGYTSIAELVELPEISGADFIQQSSPAPSGGGDGGSKSKRGRKS